MLTHFPKPQSDNSGSCANNPTERRRHKRGRRVAEARAAHREILNGHLPELASLLAQAIAISHELHKIAVNDGGAQRRRNWLEKASVVVEELKEIRPRVRCQLWGLDEGLRTMARVPDWVNQYVGDHAALGHDSSRKQTS